MATVSELTLKRAMQVCNELSTLRDRDAVIGVIKQALLAERRLAMEEAAKIVDERAFALHESEDYDRAEAVAKAATFIRAAAEKEPK